MSWMETRRIVLAPDAHWLPYHHPVELAHRVAYLDDLAQGRLIFGIGAGGLPGGWLLFNVDGVAGEHRRMTAEALEIILKMVDGREAVSIPREILEHESDWRGAQRRAQAPHFPLSKTASADWHCGAQSRFGNIEIGRGATRRRGRGPPVR